VTKVDKLTYLHEKDIRMKNE